MEANALYEASRRREATVARTRHESVHDPSVIIDDAKKELYKVSKQANSINYRSQTIVELIRLK